MRVLQVINNLGSGGAEKLLTEIALLMTEYPDIQIDILLLTDRNNVFDEKLKEKNIKVTIIKYRNIYDFRNILEIKKYITSGKYDIVHSHIFPTQYWVALSRLLIRDSKTKYVTTEHNTYNRRRNKFYFRPMDTFIYSQYDYIISITTRTKDNLTKWINYKNRRTDKHLIIENGLDIEKINKTLPYSKRVLVSNANDDTKLICMVSRFSEAKDQPTLIKAVSKVSQNVHLVLVGEGPLLEQSKGLADELGISHRVHFLGFRQDVFEIIRTVDINVLSSHWEGLSLASIEGLASGKPFIASDVEGLSEVVKEYGILFQEGDYNELSNIIEKILKNEDLYYTLSNQSFERAKDFSIESTIKKTLSLYKECIE